MSGFAAVFHFDGAPVEPGLLDQVQRVLEVRGPDRQHTWTQGSVGLVHSLLQIADEDAFDRQPLTLDERVWIVADARVDARGDLIHSLRQAGDELPGSSIVPDCELILRAYLRWGEGCLDRLIGDFAFVIWDARERKVLAAHDQFGVVPLYYASTSRALIISNTINAIRRHPAVSDELNEQAIGDFLCLGMNCDTSRTYFSDIHRVRPSHSVSWRNGRSEHRCYWTHEEALCVEPEESVGAYVERFRTTLDEAVRDRLRGPNFATHLSGGLDSTSVAVGAKRLLCSQGRPGSLRAYTNCVSPPASELDYPFTSQVAEFAEIPLKRFSIDDFVWASTSRPKPEPYLNHAGTEDEIFRQCAESRSVLLTGYGGDPLLTMPRGYLRRLLLAGKWGPLYRSLRHRKGIGGFGLLAGLRQRRSLQRDTARESQYLAAEFAAIYHPHQRIAEIWEERLRRDQRPAMAGDPLWVDLFSEYDPDTRVEPQRPRHPFLAVRLLGCAGSTPSRLCRRKGLLREAMVGRLPEPVRLRRKTGFGSRWASARVADIQQQGAPSWVREVLDSQEISRYLEIPGAQDLDQADHERWLATFLRGIELAKWLEHLA